MQNIKSYEEHAHNQNSHNDDLSFDSQMFFALTRYMKMLLQLDNISSLQNFLTDFCIWVLLAEYMIFLNIFTSLCHFKIINDAVDNEKAGKHVVDVVQNVSLLWLVVICCIDKKSEMCWLWWKWPENYVWLINRIFL